MCVDVWGSRCLNVCRCVGRYARDARGMCGRVCEEVGREMCRVCLKMHRQCAAGV